MNNNFNDISYFNSNDYTDQTVSQRQRTIYKRTYERNIPSQPLQPYLDARPVQTKYSLLPVIDPRKSVATPLIQQATFSPSAVFNPGNDSAPWSGYASNVNRESELKNQIFALQSCSQATYIPSSKSSLYQVKWENGHKPDQPFPDLFKTEQFSPCNPNPNTDKIGFGLFNNATRQQIRDLTN
jgi:hypothetical protein